MKDNFIHVCFIIDSSGSMWQSTDDVIGGFNRTIKEQKDVKNGKCSVSLFKFNDTVEEVYVGKDVNEIDGIEYKAGGCTAMNDGIGTAITKIGEWLRNAIRVVIWKQWKVPNKQIPSLVKLGINEEEAKGLTFCRRGYQFIAHSCVVHRAISNSRLKRRGLLDPLEYYLKPIA